MFDSLIADISSQSQVPFTQVQSCLDVLLDIAKLEYPNVNAYELQQIAKQDLIKMFDYTTINEDYIQNSVVPTYMHDVSNASSSLGWCRVNTQQSGLTENFIHKVNSFLCETTAEQFHKEVIQDASKDAESVSKLSPQARKKQDEIAKETKESWAKISSTPTMQIFNALSSTAGFASGKDYGDWMENNVGLIGKLINIGIKSSASKSSKTVGGDATDETYELLDTNEIPSKELIDKTSSDLNSQPDTTLSDLNSGSELDSVKHDGELNLVSGGQNGKHVEVDEKAVTLIQPPALNTNESLIHKINSVELTTDGVIVSYTESSGNQVTDFWVDGTGDQNLNNFETPQQMTEYVIAKVVENIQRGGGGGNRPRKTVDVEVAEEALNQCLVNVLNEWMEKSNIWLKGHLKCQK